MSNLKTKARATARFVRISSSKLHRILHQLRGKSYKDALIILAFLPYTSCSIIRKTLRSAAANAKYTFERVNQSTLFISEAFANQGTSMKRIRPAARGRSWRFLKRTSTVTIVLTQL